MKKCFCLLVLSLLASAVNVQAQQQTSRSLGKFVADTSLDLSAGLKSAAGVGMTSSNSEAKNTSAAISGTSANRHDQNFWIYDANVTLLSDLDGDGFHHALNVKFDIDVNYDSASVYAKLYLSKNGGPWSQYHTTELFNIYGDDYIDEYEVTTELVEGFAPGYYAILIEVFSLNHEFMVTSEILDPYYLGKQIQLEDLSWDEEEVYVSSEISYSYGGGGSFPVIFLTLVLIFQVMIAARGNLTLTPVKR